MTKSNLIFVSPGGGKTTLAKEYKNVIDMGITDFQWQFPAEIQKLSSERRKLHPLRAPNPGFPNNMHQAIRKGLAAGKLVLCPLDPTTLQFFKDGIYDPFFVFASKECKREYIERFKARGNNEWLIEIFEEGFEKFADHVTRETEGHQRAIMQPGEFLKDILIREKYKLVPHEKNLARPGKQ